MFTTFNYISVDEFIWDNYLEETGSDAVPVYVFVHVSIL